ncbi:hypothetical protein ABN584_01825 [Gloeocapsa sp. BRSZ]
MKLDVRKIRNEQSQWSIKPFLNQVQPEFTANSWVQLRELLCQLSSGEWVAWVPQYGETILDAHQFYALY